LWNYFLPIIMSEGPQPQDLFSLPYELLEMFRTIKFDYTNIPLEKLNNRYRTMCSHLIVVNYVNIPERGVYCEQCIQFKMEQDDQVWKYVNTSFVIKNRIYTNEDSRILINLYYLKCDECNQLLAKFVERPVPYLL